MKKETNSINYLSILGIIFITLKLCKVIAWSWWWVLAPFWGQDMLLLLSLLFSAIQKYHYRCHLYNNWTGANGNIHWDYKTNQMYDDDGNVIEGESYDD